MAWHSPLLVFIWLRPKIDSSFFFIINILVLDELPLSYMSFLHTLFLRSFLTRFFPRTSISSTKLFTKIQYKYIYKFNHNCELTSPSQCQPRERQHLCGGRAGRSRKTRIMTSQFQAQHCQEPTTTTKGCFRRKVSICPTHGW